MKVTIPVPAVPESSREALVCDVCGKEGISYKCFVCGKDLCGSWNTCHSSHQWPDNTSDCYDFHTCKEHHHILADALREAYDRYQALLETLPGMDELLKEELDKGERNGEV